MSKRADRTFLFLQGPLSPLYACIADRLRDAGVRVIRVNLCPGDWLFWRRRGAIDFRGRFAEWPEFLRELIDREQVTDLLLHGDRRPYHKAAIEIAEARNLQVAATELGLLRSGWLSIERGGASTMSHFPDDPGRIRAIAETAGDIDFSPKYPSGFKDQALPHLAYHIPNTVLWFLYPHYRRYLASHPLLDYVHWIGRLASARKRRARAQAEWLAVSASKPRFFILPLQLEGDFQLRALSPFSSMRQVLETAISSFAQHAPSATRLIVKTHPLDHGAVDWAELTTEVAGQFGVAERVHCLDAIGLSPLIADCAGMVTVNSTAGFEALQQGKPVKTLAPAHFDIAGLTDSGPLDGFWRAPQAPDSALFEAYRKALAVTTHVRGSITNREGIRDGAEAMANRLLANRLNEPGGFVNPAPRVARALAMGCPL